MSSIFESQFGTLLSFLTIFAIEKMSFVFTIQSLQSDENKMVCQIQKSVYGV